MGILAGMLSSYKDDLENQDSIIRIAWPQDKVSFAIRIQKQYFAIEPQFKKAICVFSKTS
ncbi:MAG: hypothetical protein CFE25_17230 [Chitinophagaceae bacterium BSSC1]|nr:MAG: hypothetical protein CFE25_17230 [Chitinophagaceae bacterium BSSC1]